jgi:hypothetical protein
MTICVPQKQNNKEGKLSDPWQCTHMAIRNMCYISHDIVRRINNSLPRNRVLKSRRRLSSDDDVIPKSTACRAAASETIGDNKRRQQSFFEKNAAFP